MISRTFPLNKSISSQGQYLSNISIMTICFKHTFILRIDTKCSTNSRLKLFTFHTNKHINNK